MMFFGGTCLMSAKIFVGNLPFSVDNRKLEEEFARYGRVVSAKVILDKNSGRSRGYGFVEFAEEGSASGRRRWHERPGDGRSQTHRQSCQKSGLSPRQKLNKVCRAKAFN